MFRRTFFQSPRTAIPVEFIFQERFPIHPCQPLISAPALLTLTQVLRGLLSALALLEEQGILHRVRNSSLFTFPRFFTACLGH
jgi:hypothetical protein